MLLNFEPAMASILMMSVTPTFIRFTVDRVIITETMEDLSTIFDVLSLD